MIVAFQQPFRDTNYSKVNILTVPVRIITALALGIIQALYIALKVAYNFLFEKVHVVTAEIAAKITIFKDIKLKYDFKVDIEKFDMIVNKAVDSGEVKTIPPLTSLQGDFKSQMDPRGDGNCLFSCIAYLFEHLITEGDADLKEHLINRSRAVLTFINEVAGDDPNFYHIKPWLKRGHSLLLSLGSGPSISSRLDKKWYDHQCLVYFLRSFVLYELLSSRTLAGDNGPVERGAMQGQLKELIRHGINVDIKLAEVFIKQMRLPVAVIYLSKDATASSHQNIAIINQAQHFKLFFK